MKQVILGTGLSGLVGTRIVELLDSKYSFTDLSLATGVDITQKEVVTKHIQNSQSAWVIHMAAKTDVDGCEKDKSADQTGAAWQINVEGTRNIVEAADQFHKRVLYISTDFVFDGTEKVYTENSIPHPINWYGQTKYAGEQVVLNSSQNIVLRIAYPYRAKCGGPKKDFVHTLYHRLQRNESLTVLTDHIFTPTFIDDIAKSIETLIAKNASGIYHGVGGASLSPFEAAQVLARQFGFDERLITGVKTAGYYQGRAPRPLELRLKNDKIASLGVTMRAFGQGLEEIKRQGII